MTLPKLNNCTARHSMRLELIERLRLAMSPAYMLEILQRDWLYPRQRGLQVTDCQLIRVHPRGAKGFVLEYEVRFQGNEGERLQQLFGELVNGQVEHQHRKVIESLCKTRRKQLSWRVDTDLIACFPEIGMLLRFPGLDERLYGLKLIYKLNKGLDPILMPYISPSGDRVSGICAEFLGHRLGRRCIVRFRFDLTDRVSGSSVPGSVIAKMYKSRSERGRETAAAMEYLCSNGFGKGSDIRIPRPLAYLPELQVHLMEDVPGVPLSEIEGAAIRDGVRVAGAALAKLHRSTLEVPGCYTVTDEITLLEGWVTLVSEIYPRLNISLMQALETVRKALGRYCDVRPALVHRDFYEKQVLIDGEHAILIDFDTLCRADPAVDVGNFLAHLHLAGEQGRSDLREAEEDFLAGYSDALSTDLSKRAVVYTQSSLLRLACLYSFWPRWSHVAVPLLEVLHGIRPASV